MIATRATLLADSPEPKTGEQICAAEGCDALGLYRAPKSRDTLRDYHWFCLPHVRAYNAAWDYYKGMSAGEIEANLRWDTLWQRPTWPLGRAGQATHAADSLDQKLGIMLGIKPQASPQLPGEVSEALTVLGLAWPVSLTAVKSTYKKLAKRYHPDANNGDKAAEERFKSINLAYITLSDKFANLLLGTATAPAP
jgi:DnaJ-domain-containing protein 1